MTGATPQPKKRYLSRKGSTPRHRLQARAGLSLLVVCWPTLSHADPKQVCIDNYVQAQSLRKEGKLRSAREALLVCAREECPARLQKDCTGWLTEVEQSMPSVVIIARDSNGHERSDVRVLIDGATLLQSLQGKAIAVDPGMHIFRYETSGSAAIEEKVVINEGEKSRQLIANFASSASRSEERLSSKRANPIMSRPVPTTVYIAGGVALAALGAATYFDISGLSDHHHLDTCKPHCSSDEVDSSKKKFLYGDTSLGVGIIALGAAAYWFFTRPALPAANTESSFAPPSLRISPAPGGGATMGWRSTFLQCVSQATAQLASSVVGARLLFGRLRSSVLAANRSSHPRNTLL